MITKTVRSQADLDAALADNTVTYINIQSDKGVWLTLSNTGSATVEAFGSATVQASGSATVRASGSATVEASGSATVRAFGSATVRAFDSATVEAFDSATVHGKNNARIAASSHVAVHLHHSTVTVTGGVVIDVSNLDLTDSTVWADHHGVTTNSQGHALLYKAIDDNYNAGHRYIVTRYLPGETVTCPDWRDDNDCGGGLHLSPSPSQAREYFPEATRYVEVSTPLDGLRPIPGGTAKCKVPSCVVVREVDLFGRVVVRDADNTAVSHD